MIGVNLAGAEFGSGRGTYGTDYTYPSSSELNYYHSKGIDLIRLPLSWERLQPVLGGEVDPAELGRLQTFLVAADELGMKVVLDLHNYGRYDGAVIGSSAVPIGAFQEFWSKLAAQVSHDPSVYAYGLMNEPHDMGGDNVWPQAAQAAVNAIRAVDSEKTIIVAGDSWSGASQWQEANKNLLVSDPSNKILYEAHVYFDHDGSGTYGGTYDQESAYPTIGVDRLQPFLDWLAQNGVKGFIGEYGVPNDDPRWLDVLNKFVTALDDHNVDSAYWAGGPWWGAYRLAIEPHNGVDTVQMNVLEQHIVQDAGTAIAQVIHGSGIDPVVYHGMISQYSVQTADSGITVREKVTNRDGWDLLVGVERIQFSDVIVAYDVNGDAGQAYRLYQAAFDRSPDRDGLTYWIKQLDHGTTLASVASSFIESNEFKIAYGDPAGLSSSEFLKLLYANVLGRSPDPEGLVYWQGQVDHGLPRDSVLVSFSESVENKTIVGSVISHGMLLDPTWMS